MVYYQKLSAFLLGRYQSKAKGLHARIVKANYSHKNVNHIYVKDLSVLHIKFTQYYLGHCMLLS